MLRWTVRTTIISWGHHGLLGAEESLDKVGHCVLMPQWIASEDGVRLRPARAWRSISVNVMLALAPMWGAMLELPQLFELSFCAMMQVIFYAWHLDSRAHMG